MKKVALAIMLFAGTASAHTQTPGKVEKTVFGEVNTFEFTIVNRNDYPSAFEVLVYDADMVDGKVVTEPEPKVLGTIEELTHNESFKFRVDLRAPTGAKTHKVMCTRMKRETGYRSSVCSLVVMNRF